MVTCTIDGCSRPHHGHGYCQPHRARLLRHGNPFPDVPIGSGPLPHPKPITAAPLVDLQQRRGWSARQLADRIGATRRTVVRWRSNPNTRIDFYRADRYAINLNLDLDDLWEIPA